jgi:AcrR family transcriptional regulator
MGRHLADEIVDGALRLIDEGRSSEAVTLRAIAREVGISAPSIYAHYRDREDVLLAVGRRLFAEIADRLAVACSRAGADPVAQLLAGCREYVNFGREYPARYRALFNCEFDLDPAQFPDSTLAEFASGEGLIGAEAFLVLVEGIQACVAAGLSDSVDPGLDAVNVWVYLHGLVSLQNDLTRFPWPPMEALLDETVSRLARLHRPKSGHRRAAKP